MPQPNQLPKIPFNTGNAVFDQWLRQLTDTINTLSGYNGPTQLANHLDLQGNRIINVGKPQSPTDVVTKSVADANYSAAALRPQIEAGGSTPLQTYRALNNATQREKTSSWLKDLMSSPPNANNIDPIVTGTGPFSVTIPASVFTFADGTSRNFPSRTDSVSAPASYTITSWSITAGVCQVTLSSTPSPALMASELVYITGTGGVIDGSQKITQIVSPTVFNFQTQNTGSGSSGTVDTGGINYYFITKKSPIILVETVSAAADTPFNRLPVSNDAQQLIAVVSISSLGVVTTSTAGGGTPSNVANGGSFF